MRASYEGNRIFIGEIVVAVEQPVRKLVALDDRVVALLAHEGYADSDPRLGRNVVAFSPSGALAWRIEQSRCRTKNEQGDPIPEPFVGISRQPDGMALVAYDGGGACYTLDPESGKLSSPRLTK